MRPGRLMVHEKSHHSKGYYIGIILFLALVGWGIYHLGQIRAGFNLIESSKIESELNATIESLKQGKADLKGQLVLVQRASQVEGQAHQKVKLDLTSLQQEIFELREEVGFYRGIVAPRESAEGIRIDQFKVEKFNADNLYYFRLVLTQVKKNQRFIQGVANIVVEGAQKGLPKALEFKKITVDKKKSLRFKFRYFQKIEGYIRLPEDFAPKQVLVEVNPRKKKSIRSHFDWSLFSGNGVIE